MVRQLILQNLKKWVENQSVKMQGSTYIESSNFIAQKSIFNICKVASIVQNKNYLT